MAEETIANADWSLVADHLHHELEAWICFGTMPRSRFLLAVLASDLVAAELVANRVEDASLPDLVHFLETFVPRLAFGGLAKMMTWEFLGGLEGRDYEEMVAS